MKADPVNEVAIQKVVHKGVKNLRFLLKFDKKGYEEGNLQ